MKRVELILFKEVRVSLSQWDMALCKRADYGADFNYRCSFQLIVDIISWLSMSD
jgi:hypothetical protein